MRTVGLRCLPDERLREDEGSWLKFRARALQEFDASPRAIWKKHGALKYVDAIRDEIDVQDEASFPRLAGVARRDGRLP